MKKYLCLLLTFGSLVSCSSHVTTQCLTSKIEKTVSSGKPVLKVGNTVIYEGQIDLLMEIMPGFRASWDSSEDKKQLVAQLIEQELFYQKAKEQNLLSTNERLQKNLWLQIRNYQAGTYLLQEVDKRAHEEYEKNKDQLFSQVEIRDNTILFKNTGTDKPEEQLKIALQKAKTLRKKLTSKNFPQIASEETENLIAKADGGKIGMISWIDQRVKFMGWQPLVETAFKLKKGKVSDSIVTGEGVHIIQVISDKQTQSYEEASTFLRTQLESEVKKELLEKMLHETKIEYLDPSLAPNEESTKK
jgi:DNA-binding XRE family transcriptional regulator